MIKVSMQKQKIKMNYPTKNWQRFAFLPLICALLVFSISLPALAVSTQDLQKLQQEINQVQNDSEYKLEAQGVLGVEASSISEAISKLQGQIDASEARINQLQGDVDNLNRQITEAEAELERQKLVLIKIIRVIYIDGDVSTIEMLATSDTFSDFVDKQEYRESVSSKIQTVVAEIDKLKKELSIKRGIVQATINEQQALRDQLASQRAEKDRILALNQEQQNQLEGQIIANSAKLAQLKKEKAEGEAALAQALNSGSYRQASAGPVSAGDVVGAIGNTGFSSGPHLHLEMRGGRGIISPSPYINRQPVDMPPAWVSQGYGVANYIYSSGYHSGIDYAARSGAAIYAIADGQMYRGCSNDLLGTTRNNYGYVAIVEHPGGVKSIYAHMSGGPAACNYNTYY